MVNAIDATTTDRLRRSLIYFIQSPSCARTASLHGVNHNLPFPTAGFAGVWEMSYFCGLISARK